MIDKKRTAQIYGLEAEQISCQFFQKLGYQILQQNFRCPGAEIDLIAYKEKTLIFVEIKARNNPSYSPLFSVNKKKLQKLSLGARLYLCKTKKLPLFDQIRFDFVVLTGSRVAEHRKAVFFL